MAEFVVNVWNQFASPAQFENEIPLLANGRRMAMIGIKNRIHVCFLEGMDQLPQAYLQQVRELGFELHDVSAIAAECSHEIPMIVDRYKNWGGIKHFCFLRFLTMPKIFGNTSIITFDGDMIINTPLDEIEAVVGDTFTFLSNSSCLGSLPASSGFFEIFEENLMRLERDPDNYVTQVMGLPNADTFFDPHTSGGTDQAFIRHLLRKGIVPYNNSFEIFEKAGISAFSNWLLLDELGLKNQKYERRNGIDYLNDKKVLISHMSHDTYVYFGQCLIMKRWFDEESIDAFGRIPIIFDHYDRAKYGNIETLPLFKRIYMLMWQDPEVRRLSSNPFWRSNIVDYFYNQSDFSNVFNDRVWHTPGVFV